MCIVCEIKADLSKTKATAEQAAAIMANVEKLARAMGGVIDVVEAAHARKPDVFKPEELATIAEAEELFAQSEALPPLAAALLGALLGGDVGLQQEHAGELGLDLRVGEGEALHLLAGDAPVGIEVAHIQMKDGENPEQAIERYMAERNAEGSTKH